MNCPKCHEPTLEVTNSYPTGGMGRMQRCTCAACNAVVVIQITVEIVEIDPPYGRGAATLAKGLNGSKVRSLRSPLEPPVAAPGAGRTNVC